MLKYCVLFLMLCIMQSIIYSLKIFLLKNCPENSIQIILIMCQIHVHGISRKIRIVIFGERNCLFYKYLFLNSQASIQTL